MSAQIESTQFGELEESNGFLGDGGALAAQWGRTGYWLFRGVLDLEALGRFRAVYLDELKRIGIVDADETEPRYNGGAMSSFPKPAAAGFEPFPGLVKSRLWLDFLNEPSVDRFFTELLGGKPGWVPVAEYRILPPREDAALDRILYPHQDGFYNEGYAGLTCWIPVWHVPRNMGGLIVAEGMHNGPYLHDLGQPPRYPIPKGAIPRDAWHTTDFRMGDVLIFDRMLPHAGLRNHSDRHFRLSFDVRCVRPGEPFPLVGTVVSADAQAIVVRDTKGQAHRLSLTADSYCRGIGIRAGVRLTAAEVAADYVAGQEVMVTSRDNAVILLREPKY